MLVYAAAFMLDLAAGTDESKITSPLWPPSPTRASPKPLESDASSLGHAAVLAALTVPLLLCGCQGVGAHECLESNLSFEAARDKAGLSKIDAVKFAAARYMLQGFNPWLSNSNTS